MTGLLYSEINQPLDAGFPQKESIILGEESLSCQWQFQGRGLTAVNSVPVVLLTAGGMGTSVLEGASRQYIPASTIGSFQK